MNNIIKRKWNQNSMVIIEDLQGMAFQAESGGHTFQISGIDDDGNTVALTGTPAGVLLRPDNTDVALTCSVSGGVVSATLPANCYDVPGRFGLTIFITSGSSKTAIYAAVGTVTRTSSGTVAPGTSQSVVDLINAINAAVNSIPASYSALLADIAPTYSDSALYSVGQYAWYDGDLKRCIVPITTAESYTAAHWTSAVLGQDVSDLKSALNDNAVRTYIPMMDNYIVISNQTEGSQVDITPVAASTAGFHCAVVDCNPGDVFYITGGGVDSARLWAFVYEDNGVYKMLKKSGANASANNLKLSAPLNAEKLIINIRYSGHAIKGVTVIDEIIKETNVLKSFAGVMNLDWVQGGLLAASGLENETNYKLRTADYYSVSEGEILYITPTNNFTVVAFQYDSNFNYVGSNIFSSRIATENGYIRFIAEKTPSAITVPSDIDFCITKGNNHPGMLTENQSLTANDSIDEFASFKYSGVYTIDSTVVQSIRGTFPIDFNKADCSIIVLRSFTLNNAGSVQILVSNGLRGNFIRYYTGTGWYTWLRLNKYTGYIESSSDLNSIYVPSEYSIKQNVVASLTGLPDDYTGTDGVLSVVSGTSSYFCTIQMLFDKYANLWIRFHYSTDNSLDWSTWKRYNGVKDTLPVKTIPVELNWFIAGYKMTGSSGNNLTADESCAFTNGLIFQINEPMLVYSTDDSLLFASHDRMTYNNFGWKTELVLMPGYYAINAKTADGSAIETSDIEKIRIRASDNFINQLSKPITETNSAKELLSDIIINKYKFSTSGSRIGMGIYQKDNTCAFIPFSLYADKDCYILMGKRNDSTLDIFINGELYKTLTAGEFIKIEKGTKFALCINGTDVSDKMPNVLFALDGVWPKETLAYGCAIPTYDREQPHINVTTEANGKVINIGLGASPSEYYVIDGETIFNYGSLEEDIPSIGHPCAGNYHNGKVYISDHVQGGNIYVFDFDDEENTLTYSKTITLPGITGVHAGSHYVFDNEEQIISLLWSSGDSASSGNYLIVMLWVKTSDSYVVSWQKNVKRPPLLQSFTVQDNYLYYVDDYRSPVKTRTISRVNLATGITDNCGTDWGSSSFGNNEGEGLFPISTGVFYAVTSPGVGYFVFFKAATT